MRLPVFMSSATAGWALRSLVPVVLGAVILALAGRGAPVLAQDSTAPPIVLPQELTPAVISDLLARLTDAEVRQVLADELNRQAAAQASAAPAGMPGFLDGIEQTAAEFLKQVGYLWLAVRYLPDDLPRVLDRLTEGGGLPRLAKLVGVFALAMAIGWGLQLALHRLTRRLRSRLAALPGRAFGERLPRRLARAALDLLRVGLFAIGFIGSFLVMEPAPGPFLSLVTAYLTAIVLAWLATILSRLILAPHMPGERLLAIRDATALALHAWISRIVWVAALGWLTAVVLVRVGLGYEVYFLAAAATGLLVTIMVVVAIWQARRPVAAMIRGTGEGRAGLRLRAAFAEIWHILAALYVVGIWVIWVVGLLSAGVRRIDAAVASLVIVALLPGLVRWLGAVAGNRWTPPGAAPPPAEATPPRPYRLLLERAVRLGLVLGAGILILWLWGLDVFAYTHGATASPFWHAAFNVTVTIILANFALQLVRITIERHLLPIEAGGLGDPNARARTLLPLLRNAMLVIVVVVATMIVLSSIGLDIGPLLASAGVVGIAIGFGAQALVRDIVSGIFFLIDDAFRVGEYIESGSIRGTVEAISIRSIRLRHHRGAIHTVPFGEMHAITNYMRDWTIDKITIGVAYDTDLDKAKKLIRDIGRDLAADPQFAPHILEPLKMQGVEEYGDYAIKLRLKMMTRPGEQFVIRRKALAMIKRVFDEQGIKFAFPTVQVAGGEVRGAAAAVALEAAAETGT